MQVEQNERKKLVSSRGAVLTEMLESWMMDCVKCGTVLILILDGLWEN